MIASCYLDFPGCIGCASSGEALCFMFDTYGCKVTEATEANDQSCCLLSKGECKCIKPRTCVGCTSQFFCLDERCALPCTEEIPCVFTMLPFCVLCANNPEGKLQVGCCKSLKEVMGEEWEAKMLADQGKATAEGDVTVTVGQPDDIEMCR